MTEQKLALVADIIARHARIAMAPEHLRDLIAATAQFLAPRTVRQEAPPPKRRTARRAVRAGHASSPARLDRTPDLEPPPGPISDAPLAPAAVTAVVPSIGAPPARKRLTVADLGGGLAARNFPASAVIPPPLSPPDTSAGAPVEPAPSAASAIKTSGLSKSEARAQAERLFAPRG